MERTPCFKCERRTPNCHAWCDDFKAWKERDSLRVEAMEKEKIRDAATVRRIMKVKSILINRIQKGRYHQ